MKRLLLLTMVLASLLFAASANAASATKDAYGGEGAVVTTHTSDSGSLPFTGLDVIALLGGGVALLGVGIAVRRLVGSVS